MARCIAVFDTNSGEFGAVGRFITNRGGFQFRTGVPEGGLSVGWAWAWV
jgi:hypothetical protein